MRLSRSLVGVAASMLLAGAAAARHAPPLTLHAAAPPPLEGLRTETGTLPDGTTFRMDVPANWNGALLLDLDYARPDAPFVPNNRVLIEHGYAMAGTTRAVTGWAVPKSVGNLLAVETRFEASFGRPKWPIAYGSSLGGHTVMVGVNLKPDRYAAGIALCSSPAGAIAQWNSKLDAVFVAKALIAPDSDLPVTDIPADFQTIAVPAWKTALARAQATPEGRARIALAAALGQLPEWSVMAKPRPPADDIDARQAGLYESLAGGPLPLIAQAMSSRRQLNGLAGGNISWNVGVDYAAALNRLPEKGLVEKLYHRAGMSLAADMGTLAKAPRIAPNPKALRYLEPQQYTGDLRIPVVAMHAIGDQIAPVAGAQALAMGARAAGRTALLRQVYTETAGHCTFSPAEVAATVETMKIRLETGKWPATTAAAMKARGLAAAAKEPARFIDYRSAPYLRTLSARELAEIEDAPVRAN
jgi:pimeloyl-ACP methyl ester carboxylesterase